METFTHGRLQIAHRDEGQGDAIVFLHNGGTSSTIWREQVATLSTTYRTIAVDLPGFGASPRPSPAATLDDMVEAIGVLLDELALVPALLVGNCMGSNIAVQVARRYPDRVRGVLAVNPLTAASFGAGGIGVFHRMKKVAAGPTRLLRGVSRRVPIPKPAGTATLRFQLGRKGIARGLQRDPELLACQLRADQMPALVDVLDDMDAYGALDTERVVTSVPTWIVWGAENHVLSRDRSGHLPERLDAARVEVLDGCGHLAMLEDPQVVTSLVEELLVATSTEVAR